MADNPKGFRGRIGILSSFYRQNPILALVVLVCLVRLAMLGTYPLMDTTEARYGDIGRVMAISGDWITPWFRPGIPFWAKPPLSFWATASSFKLLGVNEFSARLPHWIMGILGGFFVWDLGLRRSFREATIAVALLAGSLVYYFSSGGVMTDMALTLGLIVTMWSFWLSVQPNVSPIGNWASWLFFASLGWGLLAKGPLAIVLAGLSIGAWLFSCPSFYKNLRNLPWFRGSLLTLLIAAPWYLASEIKTPGFLNYFIIGEHFNRYLVPGWKGDMFGSAHLYPKGTIWIFLFLMLIPWSILIPALLIKSKKDNPSKFAAETTPSIIAGTRDISWRNYLLAWALMPIVFFTFASNILSPYVLPTVPAFALLGAYFVSRENTPSVNNILTTGLLIIVIGSILFPFVVDYAGFAQKRSQKNVVSLFYQHAPAGSELIYVGKVPYSASFYSNSTAIAVDDCASIVKADFENGNNIYVQPKSSKKLGKQCSIFNQSGFKPIAENRYYKLMRYKG